MSEYFADPRGDSKVACLYKRPDPPPNPPFLVHPKSAIVPARGSAKFEVTFEAPEEASDWRALMIADVAFNKDDAPLDTTTASAMDLPTSPKGSILSLVSARSAFTTKTGVSVDANGEAGESNHRSPFPINDCLKLQLVCNTINPVLHVDKRLDAMGDHVSQFLIWSTSPADHASYYKTITLTNKLAANLTFCLNISEAFTIHKCESSAAPHPLARKQGDNNIHLLPPGGVLVVTIKYNYYSVPMSTFDTNIIELKNDYLGLLTILYSNGEQQDIKLHVEIVKPTVAVSPPEYNFGRIHVEKTVASIMYMANPTIVDAKWKIIHVPSLLAIASNGSSSKDVVNMDDPEVFQFNVKEGIMRGPTLQLHAAGVHAPQGGLINKSKNLEELCVVFHPKLKGKYKSRFRFSVVGGEGFDVVLSGEGSYEEIVENNPFSADD